MGWGHHHSRQAHEALVALPPTTATTTTERGTLLATRGRRGCSLPTGRLLLLLLLTLLLLLLLLLRCRSSRRRRRWPNRLDLPELRAATTCSLLSSTTTVLALATATAECRVGSYCIDVGADQIVLSCSSHSCLGFCPSKEARASVMRDRKTSSLLKKVTTRLHDIFAKEFE